MRERTSKKTGYPLELEIDIPLHQNTDSAGNVAGLVNRVLGVISNYERDTSQRDIMQALTIVTSLRLAMARSGAIRKKRMRMDPLDVAVV